MEPVIIGAIAGGVLGAVFIAILVTCIVYFSKKIKRRTNTRAKLITSQGQVYKDKWPKEYKEKDGYFGKDGEQDKRIYFGDVDRTEHVEVKEKRKEREVIVPPKPFIIPPPPPPMPQPIPPPMFRPPPPRLKRYQYRSWERSRPPPFRRRPSFGAEKPPQYFMYGFPQQVPRPPMLVTSGAYGSWIPGPAPNQPVQPEPAPKPEPVHIPRPETPEHKDIEEQERVLVIDDAMTEKSFNPRWQGQGHSNGMSGMMLSANALDCNIQSNYQISQQHKRKEVPVIVADVI